MDIDRVEVSRELCSNFKSEEDFNELSLNLMVEFASWVCVACNIYPASTKRWNRNQAILGGMMVRLYKITSALLDQTCQRRRETTFILGRLAFECLINIRYLLFKNSTDLFQAYVIDSLRHEKKTITNIYKNISERGGVEIPIERRMINSIEKAFRKSGVSLNEISKKNAALWHDTNAYERAFAIGMDWKYSAMFGGPSSSVHGGWSDLLQYHLDYDEVSNDFSAETAWHSPRPQLFNALILDGVVAVDEYLEHLLGQDAVELTARLENLLDRVKLADEEHENFLISRTKR